MKKNRAVFLDLNGTIVLPLKQDTLEEMYLIDGADIAIQKLLSAGFVYPVVTVQARIEKGLFTEQKFRAWFAEFFQKYQLDVKGLLKLSSWLQCGVCFNLKTSDPF
jgi:histidinol phosphatase-like enzyme